MRLVLSVAAAAGVLAGCATTTKIVSTPPGATVTDVDNKRPLGKTPMTYESKMWIWQAEHLEVKAPNHKPRVVELKRSELNLLPFAGGACLTLTCCGAVGGVPLILAGGWNLPETVRVQLDPAESSAAPLSSSPPPTPLERVASEHTVTFDMRY